MVQPHKNPYQSPAGQGGISRSKAHWSWPVFGLILGLAIGYLASFAVCFVIRDPNPYNSRPDLVVGCFVGSVMLVLSFAYPLSKFSHMKLMEATTCVIILAVLIAMLWPILLMD
jgi:protein-S-isoprenylcysteine O-methyltransferase Ste14